MWIPETAEELEATVAAGSLEETNTLEAKQQFPSNKKLAKEIAALANDGGVLLIGVAEDEHDRLTKLNPVKLQGARERIDQIIQTSIQETLSVEIRALELEGDPSRGYLVIIVPASPRAPHMVIVGKDNRYYGRGDNTVRRLSEGEVARLYARREKWEIDRVAWMRSIIDDSPVVESSENGFLHIAIRPLFSSDSILEQALYSSDAASVDELLRTLLLRSAEKITLRCPDVPSLRIVEWHENVSGWISYLDRSGDLGEVREPDYIVDLHVNRSGEVRLFCGYAVLNHHSHDMVIRGQLVAHLCMLVLRFTSEILSQSENLHPVAIGLGLTNTKDAALWEQAKQGRPWDKFVRSDVAEYVKTDQVSPLSIAREPQRVASALTRQLFSGLSDGQYDPFGLN